MAAWYARNSKFGLMVVFLLGIPGLYAQQTADDFRDLARNPVGDAIKVPVAGSINLNAGPYDRTPNSLQVLVLIPFKIAEDWLLIPRIATTPVAYAPDVTHARGGSIGLGDTIATFFLTPAHTGKLIWGVGPSLLIPTATDDNLGAGKWDLGPSAAIIIQPKWGSAYLVAQNIWSLPVNSRRTSAHQMQIETSFSFNLPHDWYVVTSPTINADWTQSGGDRWLIPFGGGIGRTLIIANQAVDLSVALYSFAIRPARQLTPKWQISLQCTLIYPRKRN
jgi:hypothetical protein